MWLKFKPLVRLKKDVWWRVSANRERMVELSIERVFYEISTWSSFHELEAALWKSCQPNFWFPRKASIGKAYSTGEERAKKAEKGQNCERFSSKVGAEKVITLINWY